MQTEKLVILDSRIVDYAGTSIFLRLDKCLRVPEGTIQTIYDRHRDEWLTCTNHEDFIRSLDKALETDTPAGIPSLDNSFSDVTGADAPIIEYPKGRYLYEFYTVISKSIPYKKDIAQLINSLPDEGVSTALISDICLWDVKKQAEIFDMERFTFLWQSCRTGKSMSSHDTLQQYSKEASSYNFAEILYIGKEDQNTIQDVSQCGWRYYTYKNQSPEEIEKEIRRFIYS